MRRKADLVCGTIEKAKAAIWIDGLLIVGIFFICTVLFD